MVVGSQSNTCFCGQVRQLLPTVKPCTTQHSLLSTCGHTSLAGTRTATCWPVQGAYNLSPSAEQQLPGVCCHQHDDHGGLTKTLCAAGSAPQQGVHLSTEERHRLAAAVVTGCAYCSISAQLTIPTCSLYSCSNSTHIAVGIWCPVTQQYTAASVQ